jgi:orotate phosphoribosyltransferase
VNETEILDELSRRGALLRGHFRLSSGRHSDMFVQKFRALEDPQLAVRLGARIADAFAGQFDVVASPAVGAIVLGFSTAMAAGTRMIFAERAGDAMAFRRGFEIAPGERVLVVEDVITTGASAQELVDLVQAAGGKVIGVGALIDRGDPARPPESRVDLKALVRLDVPSWSPDECPLCEADEPLIDPGSRRLRT